MMLRFGSVCSGIEAASCAWHPLGWRAVFLSEIDAFPCALLAHRFPDVANLGDMTNFQAWPHAAIDVLVGGTPCQSFSVAGLRRGLADPRGNLMLTFGAIASRYRPRWLVWENVPGVLSSNSGRDFGAFLGMLGELGYGFAYRVLDAQFFGVAQRRRRVFVVGCLGNWRRAAAVLFECASLRGDPSPRSETREGFAVGALRSTDGGSDLEHGRAHQLIPTVANPLTARMHKGINTTTDEGQTMIAFDTTQITNPDNRCNPKPGDPCNPIIANGHPPAIAFSCKDHGADTCSDITPPLRSMNNADSHANGGGQIAVAFKPAHYTRGKDGEPTDVAYPLTREADKGDTDAVVCERARVRRLTPRKCERLQGFPDDYTLVPYRGKRAADGPRYKALGNSMAVPVMRWIGSRIEAVEALQIEAGAA